MTAQTKTTLKGYFNTGDVPSEANFADLIDSLALLTANVFAVGQSISAAAAGGTIPVALTLVNQSDDTGTGIALNFVTNVNASYPFGQIQANKPGAAIGGQIVFSTINQSAPYQLLPRMFVDVDGILNTTYGIKSTGRLYLGNYFDENGIVGNGLVQLRVQDSHNQIRLVNQSTTGPATTGQNWLAFDLARGTYAAPTAPLNGDIFGAIVCVGNFTGGGHGGQIKFYAEGDWSPTARGSAIDFVTISSGTTTEIVTMSLRDGNVLITGALKVDDVQVVGNRVIDARCDDAINSGDATTDGVIDALRDAMIAHGLIAAA